MAINATSHDHEHEHDPSGVLGRLLSSNEQWASDVEQAESGFFTEMSKGQAPKVSFVRMLESGTDVLCGVRGE